MTRIETCYRCFGRDAGTPAVDVDAFHGRPVCAYHWQQSHDLKHEQDKKKATQ